MAWQRLTFVILIAGAFVTGCAGAEHQLPEITQAESYSAAQTITAAPSLAPTTRTRSENERMARKVLGKLQGVASLICEATEQNKCWYTLELSPDGEMNAYVLKNEIVMHNGLAQYLQTEDEFAVVIAHEMGHHIAHHYDKGFQNRASGAAKQINMQTDQGSEVFTWFICCWPTLTCSARPTATIGAGPFFRSSSAFRFLTIILFARSCRGSNCSPKRLR